MSDNAISNENTAMLDYHNNIQISYKAKRILAYHI